MAGAEKNAALAFWKETMEYERMLPRIGYPGCEEPKIFPTAPGIPRRNA